MAKKIEESVLDAELLLGGVRVAHVRRVVVKRNPFAPNPLGAEWVEVTAVVVKGSPGMTFAGSALGMHGTTFGVRKRMPEKPAHAEVMRVFDKLAGEVADFEFQADRIEVNEVGAAWTVTLKGFVARRVRP